MRVRRAMLAAMLLSGCFPSFEVSSEGGADAGRDRSAGGCTDAAGDCALPDGGREAAADAVGDGSRCVPIAFTPEPAHGGAACPMDGSACSPGDMTTFSPKWIPPNVDAPYANTCTNQEIANAFADCWAGTATLASCNAFQAASKTCFQCILTQSTQPLYGPIIYYEDPSGGGISVTNVAACIALAEPCNLPCAEAILADTQCQVAACLQGSCATASSDAVVACTSEAEMCSACSGYFDSQGCYMKLLADPASHPSAVLCDLASPGGGIFAANFTAISTYLCGPPPG
jgi:hypothetical protein